MRLKQLLKQIILSSLLIVLFQAALTQNKLITGKITDSNNGSPLTNVSIIVKATALGTQTDADGNFRFMVPLSVSSLIISAVGFYLVPIMILFFSVFLMYV